MATSAQASRPIRRSMSSHAAPTATSIARGATARSAVSPKVTSLNGVNRRGSASAAALKNPLSLLTEGEVASSSQENLVNALKRETEEKEELLIRVQNKDQAIAELTKENADMTASLNTTETRLAELYADQARIEEETAARLELVERLRVQIQELEKDKRDLQRRYNEQTATFDAERQSFYDNEQHLKSRIQSLLQARKTETSQKPVADNESHISLPETEDPLQERVPSPLIQMSLQPRDDGSNSESAVMTSLRLELSTLSTSYASLQNTVQHLSAQLLDLKRVNNHLQEENESYNILLREKTINGQFDILKTVGTKGSDEGSTGEDDSDDDGGMDIGDEDSTLSRTRTPLDPVDELAEDMDPAVYDEGHISSAHSETGSQSSSHGPREQSRRFGRGGRRNVTVSRSPVRKGESLADLPVAGPGLDLAAELGRAENQASVDGKMENLGARHCSASTPKTKRGRRTTDDRKTSDAKGELNESSNDIDALRNEVKSLKDANKALSLYASKIIDRIIAQEGFEHVLAADYERPQLPPPKSPQPQASAQKDAEDASASKKSRHSSGIFGLTLPSPEAAQAESIPPTIQEPRATKSLLTVEDKLTPRLQRRSLSFDWRGFSMFGGSSDKKPEQNPNLRPLSLRPGTTVVGARKLDTLEDEEDRKERERLHATMKLLGIEKPTTSAAPTAAPTPTLSTSSSPGASSSTTPKPENEFSSSKPASSRFLFFRSRSNTSDNSGNTAAKPSLTTEALEHAEAETTLAELDEREKLLSAEIAKGSNGGFTELPSRRHRSEEWRSSRRSRRSGGSGSGSTIWSAGMSTQRGEDSADEQGRLR